MKILVVNDDSIHSPGIALLAKAAMELGEVTVVASAHQCSAMSQKITICGDMRVDKVEDFPVPVKAAYKVDGTPVDCVKIALQYLLEERPDYVFSGINDGYNTGFDIAYSGTMGAAFEAVMNGVPAMAFSSTMNAPSAYRRGVSGGHNPGTDGSRSGAGRSVEREFPGGRPRGVERHSERTHRRPHSVLQ